MKYKFLSILSLIAALLCGTGQGAAGASHNFRFRGDRVLYQEHYARESCENL